MLATLVACPGSKSKTGQSEAMPRPPETVAPPETLGQDAQAVTQAVQTMLDACVCLAMACAQERARV